MRYISQIRIVFMAVITGLGFQATAQVKIGNNPTAIDTAAILELNNPNKALFLTRVALTSTTDVTTVPNPKAGFVVYNTNAALTTTNSNFPASGAGVYYFDGTFWVYSGVGNLGSNFWSLDGNSNAADGANFLGTTNDVAMNFRVFNTRAGRLDLEGNSFFGYQAGLNAATQVQNSDNTLMGSSAGSALTIGKANTAIGRSALQNTNNWLAKYSCRLPRRCQFRQQQQ